MLLLALETASEVGGVALLSANGSDELCAERTLGSAQGGSPHHASEILTALEDMLAAQDAREADIDTLALSVGPGSFTGLRIGLATALGLCFGTGRQIVPVPTLAALALDADARGPVVPMLDARKGQVYTGLYDPGGAALAADRVIDPIAWLAELSARDDAADLCFLGPGARLYQNEIRSSIGEGARLLPAERGQPRASRVAALGARLHREGRARDPRDIRLVYLRPSEAEEKRAGHLPCEPIS